MNSQFLQSFVYVHSSFHLSLRSFITLSFVRAFVRAFVRVCVRSYVRAFARFFVRSCVCLFVGSFFLFSARSLVSSLSSVPFCSVHRRVLLSIRSPQKSVQNRFTVLQRPILMIIKKAFPYLFFQISTSGPRAL